MVIRMRARSSSITILRVTCLILLAMAPASWAGASSRYHVRAVKAIPLDAADGNRSAPVEVSKQGTLLVFPWKIWWLLVWDYQRQQAAFEFPKNDEWASWENKAEGIRGDWQFRFQGDGSRIVGIQTPWLVLIDVEKQVEIGRALPSESYLRRGSPGQPSAWAGVRICHLGIDPLNGSVAAAYNTGKDTQLYVYDRDLRRQIGSWPLPRMVKDICWSPDGKKLAVLFHGRFDENRELHFVDNHLADTLPEPDVWVMDARSGEALLKFRTGTAQDQIAFSRDGSSLYVINDYMYGRGGVIGAFSPDHRGAIRVFSAVSGALVQTITSGPRGVHSGFCLSPDGSLIAADASTYFMSFRMMETAPGEKIARVVLLDAKTGHLLFEHHERTNGDISDPLGLAFSPDGRLLFVDFPGTYMKPQRIQVYSIDAFKGPKSR